MVDADSYTQKIQDWYNSFRFLFVNIGLKLGYSKNELDDIINKFFLELLEKKIDTASIKNPQAYLSIAFRRKLTDNYRAHKRNHFIGLDNIIEEYFEPSVQEMLEQIEADRELIIRIRQAYEKLPKRCQKVIYLKFYEGLTTEGIVEKSGLNKRTVYNNLFEGIKMLRSELSINKAAEQFAILLSLLSLAFTKVFFKV